MSVKTQNELALASVKAIYDAAEEAQAEAERAHSAADDAAGAASAAQTSANNAQTSADNAATAASDAQSQATTATKHANAALDQLGIVEDVVGVLKLLSTNAEYQLTNDTEISEGKWYFTRSGYAGGSYSGSIATFETTAGDNIESLIVDIEPIQDLNGYDKPWVGGAGKNKLYIAPQTLTSNGITWTVNADGTVTAKGTLTATNSAVYINATVPTGSYKFNGSGTGSANSTYYAQVIDGSNWYDPDYGNRDVDVTISSTNVRVYFATKTNPPSGGITFKPMLRLASETDATYEPYSNICPISGRTEVVTHRTGKNLAEMVADGMTPSLSNGNLVSYPQSTHSQYIKVNPSASYTASFGNTLLNGVFQYDADKNFVRVDQASSTTKTVTTTSNTAYIMLRCDRTAVADPIPLCQLEAGTEATDYEPYNGQAYTTSLGRTVYGGTLDVVSGVLTVDRAIVTLNGSETWAASNGNATACMRVQTRTNVGFKPNTSNVSLVGNISSAFVEVTPNKTWDGTIGFSVSIDANPYLHFCQTGQKNMSVEAWKTYLASNPIQVVGLLATPQTYQLTPQQVATLLGVNNVWADCGSVSVAVKSTYSYAVVTNPVIADIANYYEIVSIDEAVQDYVVSRLAVTSAGLWVQDPNMNTKILLSSTDGVVIYGPTGQIVGKYGSTAQVGDASSFHIEMDGTELGFYQGSQRVAYINNNQLYITQSVVLQQMDLGIPVANGGLGQWSWKVHPNGQNPSRNNLNLKWIG